MFFDCLKKRWRGSSPFLLVCCFVLVLFLTEWLEYSLLPLCWPAFPRLAPNSIRMLIVSDPQLLGYSLSPPGLLGSLCRWDADRYVSRTFNQAHHYVEPDLVIFLGDNLDEGELALDEEFHDYIRRFQSVFRKVEFHKILGGAVQNHVYKIISIATTTQVQLATINEGFSHLIHFPTMIYTLTAIIVPGDNDIGGEDEPPSPELERRFNQYFREDVFLLYQFLEFVKVNYISHSNDYLSAPNSTDSFRIALSHIPLTPSYSTFVARVIPYLKPHLILSAHDHKSGHWVVRRPSGDSANVAPELDVDSFRFNLSEPFIHEIMVPTCSYRMGTLKMGYGALELCPSGDAFYTVLWLPSRFRQLFILLLCALSMGAYLMWVVSRTYCKCLLSQSLYKHQKFYFVP